MQSHVQSCGKESFRFILVTLLLHVLIMNSFQARGCSFFVVRPAIDKKSFGFFFFKVTWIVHFGVVQNDSEFKVQGSKLL